MQGKKTDIRKKYGNKVRQVLVWIGAIRRPRGVVCLRPATRCVIFNKLISLLISMHHPLTLLLCSKKRNRSWAGSPRPCGIYIFREKKPQKVFFGGVAPVSCWLVCHFIMHFCWLVSWRRLQHQLHCEIDCQNSYRRMSLVARPWQQPYSNLSYSAASDHHIRVETKDTNVSLRMVIFYLRQLEISSKIKGGHRHGPATKNRWCK